MNAAFLLPATISSNWPGNFWWHLVILTVLLVGLLMTSVVMYIWLERRVIARFQARLGPNRAGPFGLLQSFADVIKILTKEDIIPTLADKIIFWLAPVMAFAPVLMVMAVIPLADGLQLADINVGVLYISAVSAVTAMGIFMSGMASNNKYSLIGAMRETAQLISYEIPMVLALAALVMASGSMSISAVIGAQNLPFALTQPLSFVIFFVALLAEINRTPFDLVEADSELTAGFNTEYSGMKFAVLYLVEYSEAVIASILISTFFLGGWRGPFLPGIVWLVIKMLASFFVILWIRSTIPRFRIDQSMKLAWKALLPLAVINLFLMAVKTVFAPGLTNWVGVPVYFIVTAGIIILWARFMRQGRQTVGI